MLGNLEVGGDQFEAKDDVYRLKLAISVYEDLKSQDLVQQVEVHQALSFGSGLFFWKQKMKRKFEKGLI